MKPIRFFQTSRLSNSMTRWGRPINLLSLLINLIKGHQEQGRPRTREDIITNKTAPIGDIRGRKGGRIKILENSLCMICIGSNKMTRPEISISNKDKELREFLDSRCNRHWGEIQNKLFVSIMRRWRRGMQRWGRCLNNNKECRRRENMINSGDIEMRATAIWMIKWNKS